MFKRIKFVLFSLLITFSTSSFSKECNVKDATVTQVHQYKDGTIFINVNKNSNCSCSQPVEWHFINLKMKSFIYPQP